MNWELEFLPEALDDLKKLDGSVRPQVLKGINKVRQNPLPVSEGEYGKPLGNKNSNDLTGLIKIKFVNIGIRVVYKFIRTDSIMKTVVISARSDDQVYNEASDRRKKNDL
ncbi:MAG: type II toxin-antitoxin system RelE/ParE family toxin [Lachnospiraceae bacterium]|nr:type II toxin-antitoxin system RelE/ParE family toxin [Lachnospiraceae bacterium]